MEQYRNHKEFAAHLGTTDRTLRRKLKQANITVPKGLLSPQTQQMIKEVLGFNE